MRKLAKGRTFFIAPFHPAAGRDRIAFGIDGNDQFRAVFLCHFAGKGFVFDGLGTDDDPGHALFEIGVDGFFTADAAAHFYGDIDGVADAADDRSIAAVALEGPVEIDDVEKLCPAVSPFLCRFDGIVKIGRAVRLYALAQADGMAVLYIYSRKYDHAIIPSVRNLRHSAGAVPPRDRSFPDGTACPGRCPCRR